MDRCLYCGGSWLVMQDYVCAECDKVAKVINGRNPEIQKFERDKNVSNQCDCCGDIALSKIKDICFDCELNINR